MSEILVALATTRQSDEIGKSAVAEAKDTGEKLILLLVTESEELVRIKKLRSDPYLLGTRSVEEIISQIEREHQRKLEEQADDVERTASQEGVEVSRIYVEGRYDTEIARYVSTGNYPVIYWLKQSRGFLARFFLGVDQDEVIRVASEKDDTTGVSIRKGDRNSDRSE